MDWTLSRKVSRASKSFLLAVGLLARERKLA
jgi:hypothetical protein